MVFLIKFPEVISDDLFSRRRVPASRAVQRIVTDALVPWHETYADLRLGAMNFAVNLPVLCPEEERAVPQCPAILTYPVVDTDNVGKILF
jgi:hypothetical protein